MASSSSAPAGGAARRAALWFAVPTLAILALEVLPLVTGARTLVLRDVLEVHLMLKAPQAEALREGVLPLVDPYRFGGQPLLGNPNVVPLYPDNLLYALFPVLWALNAHFWIHLLLAPVTTFWMGRAWGLSRPAAWAAGVCYAASGFFLSQLNLYNLVAGAALAPALVAATLRAAEGRRWAVPATGALWALLLLSGDPLSAVLAGALALGAWLVRRRGGDPRSGTQGGALQGAWLLAAVVLGTLVALPQIVELLRILPASYRGYWGYGEGRLAVGAWRPIQVLEWLVPTAFGRHDLPGLGGFWGASLLGGTPPIFLSLYPGALALALVLAGGLPPFRALRRTGRTLSGATWWAWGAIGIGLLLAAGGATPVGRWLFTLPSAAAFRYPEKLWLLAAPAAALLCGIGWQRTFGSGLAENDGRRERPTERATRRSLRRLALPLAGIALILAALLAGVVAFPSAFEGAVLDAAGETWSARFGEHAAADLARAERARWIATLVAVLALALCLGLALLLARRRPVLGAALLLVLHGAGQLYLLRGLTATDRAAFYRVPPPPVAAIPDGSRVAHAGYGALFGPSRPARAAADPEGHPLAPLRQDFYSLVPAAGVLHGGYRYELNRSPEGLGSFLGRIAWEAVSRPERTDLERIRALSRWGVEAVIAERALHAVPEAWARPVGAWPGITHPVRVYRLPRAAPEVLFAEEPLRAPHLNAAWALLSGPGFDPDRHAVVPGEADDPVPEISASTRKAAADRRDGPETTGTIRTARLGSEAIEVRIDSPVPGVLVVQRSHLPIWRGAVDGEEVDVEPVNLYRLGVRVPAGEHRVRLWVDRRPLIASLVGSGVGLAGLALLGAAGLRRPARS